MLRIAISSLLVSLIIAGCSRNKTPSELIDTFSQNKMTLDSLIKSLQNDKTLDSLFFIGPDAGIPDIRQSYPKVYDMLRKVGITDASSHKNANCKYFHWYYFKTDWPNDYPIYLIFNTCDDETFKGFYRKDEYLNETWGLGDNWQMFRFVKTITNFKQ